MGKQDKIKVSSGEDLLAFIPHIVGYWPENSVVCIGMCGKSLRATMRLDLPPGPSADLERFAAIAAGQLASDHQADGTLVAFFGACDWTDPSHFPQQELYDALRVALAREGLPVRDGWYVGRENWRSVECTNPACCPWPGRSNAKISASFVNAELVFRGSTIEESPRDRIPAMTAVADAAFADRVARVASTLGRGLLDRGLAENQLSVTLGAWERALSHWPERPDASLAAYMAASLRNTSARDAVMVSLATTPESALAGVIGIGALLADVSEPVVPPNWHGGSQVAGYELADESDAAISLAADAFGDVLLGGTSVDGRLACPPDWGRLDVSEELLLFLAQSLDGPLKAPVVCMLGWIQWCRGRGTWAGSYFHAAQECLPGYKLAYLLERLLDMGHIAGWAKSQETAWPGYHYAQDAA